ncbi:hypothetical protein BT96DRAFT_937425 [Gymnopus androsaceus JB14]|uniref:Uncharacterized protein n=1 Tax=Gymnopus androsaceus JB14 TaxID=1447944 RepID=A0A6A4HY63_9AGAR|nr:hypothetical protein BT96DRAFT_937425 [Gymnopus androsaceus JB14]
MPYIWGHTIREARKRRNQIYSKSGRKSSEEYWSSGKSHQECLAKDKDPLNALTPDNREFINQHSLLPYAKVAYWSPTETPSYTLSTLKDNNIRYLDTQYPVPAFVTTKIKQLEAKRQWHLSQPEDCRCKFNTSLNADIGEFVNLEPLVLPPPDASTIHNHSIPGVHNETFLEELQILVASLDQLTVNGPKSFQIRGIEMLNLIKDWAFQTTAGVKVPQ